MVANTSPKWTEEEKTALQKGREAGLTVPEIANRIGRPVSAVYTQARKIGALVMTRKVWTDAEDAVLRDAVACGIPMTKVAETLGRTPESVRWRKASLGLTGTGPAPKRKCENRAKPAGGTARRDRTEKTSRVRKARSNPGQDSKRAQDRAALREAWAETQDLSELATRLGKSLTWVRGATLELGLREKRQRKSFDDDAAREEIRRLARTHSITEASKKLGRDPRTVRQIADEIGVEFVAATRTKPQPVRKAKKAPERKVASRSGKSPRRQPPLTPQAMAVRLKLIRKIAERMRLEGRLPPLN